MTTSNVNHATPRVLPAVPAEIAVRVLGSLHRPVGNRESGLRSRLVDIVAGASILIVGLAIGLLVDRRLGMLLAVAVGAAIIFVRAPSLVLAIVAATIPTQDLIEYPFGPIAVRITSALLLGVGGGWAIQHLWRRRRPRFVATTWPFVALVACLALSGSVAHDRVAWLQELYRWAAALLVFVVAVDVVVDIRSARAVVWGMLVGVSAASLFGITQTLLGAGPPSYRVEGWMRAYATFGAPNPLAGYLEFTTPTLFAVAGSWWLRRRASATSPQVVISPRFALLCAVGAGAGLVTLMLTQSRGGWIGGVAGVVLVAFLTGGARWAGLTMIGLALLTLVFPPVGGRLVSLAGSMVGIATRHDQPLGSDFSSRERLAHWQAALAMTRASPLVGIGAGNFSTRFAEFSPSPEFRESRGHAHNNLLQIAAQSGWLGLSAYITLLGMVTVRLRSGLRRAPAGARVYIIGACGVTLALVLHGMFDYLHVLSLGLQVSLAWALAEVWSARSSGGEPLGGEAR